MSLLLNETKLHVVNQTLISKTIVKIKGWKKSFKNQLS